MRPVASGSWIVDESDGVARVVPGPTKESRSNFEKIKSQNLETRHQHREEIIKHRGGRNRHGVEAKTLRLHS
jgi:hypothetical protein